MSFLAWVALFLVLYFLYYFFTVVKVPAFYCGPAEFRRFITANCSVLSEKYWPTVWCFHAYALTHFSTSYRLKIPKLKYAREIIPTIDGGQFPLDWYDPSGLGLEAVSKKVDRPVLLFVPGLAGTAQADNFRTMVPIAYASGYQPVVMNYRGMTSVPLLNPIMYCAANFDDLKHALEAIKAGNPGGRIIASGCSMGGTVLTGYLAESGVESLVDAAYLVSACWDCIEGTKNLERGYLNPKISRFLTQMLVKLVRRHQHLFEKYPEFVAADLDRVKTLREFDEAFTRKMFLFESADDYYRAATHKDKLHLIKVPTLVVQAADDMFALEKDLPVENVRRSGNVGMVITRRGGHLGFMDGWTSGPNGQRTYFTDRLFAQYISALASLKENPRDVFKAKQLAG